MVKPLFGSSLVAELKRDQMHSRDIAEVLRWLTGRLKEERIPFAVIGALAMRHHGYVRHTEDIDLLTTPEGLAKIHERLVGRGLVPKAKGLRKRLLETEHQVGIDLIASGEHAGAESSPVVYPVPSKKGFRLSDGYLVPKLDMLIAFKLASGIWGHRPQDLGDVFQLIKANKLRKGFERKLPAELRPKFLELLENVRLEREIE